MLGSRGPGGEGTEGRDREGIVTVGAPLCEGESRLWRNEER